MVAQLVPVPYLPRVSQSLRSPRSHSNRGRWCHGKLSPILQFVAEKRKYFLKTREIISLACASSETHVHTLFFFVFRTQKGSHVKEHNEGVKSQIKEIKEDINTLSNDGFNVEVKLDELEQYARRDCLEITGIPVVPNDSPALLVKEISEIMGVNLNENDISIAHRLPPTKKVKDRLIVKFTRREKRDEIYSKRKNLKSKRTKDLPSVVCEPESAVVSHKAHIHVNESLTPYRKRLLGRILQFKRHHNYKFIWTANGKIMMKKTESSSTKCFVTHGEFKEFFDELN